MAVTAGAFAQSTNRTSAIMEFNEVQPALAKGKQDEAKEAMAKAVEYIDLAFVHETTQNDPKTMYYAFKIYSAYIEMKGMEGDMETVGVYGAKLDQAIKNLYQYDTKKKYLKDFEREVEGKRNQAFNAGVDALNSKNYEVSYQAFVASANVYTAINKVDSAAYYYAAYSALKLEQYENAYLNYEKCIEIGFEKENSYTNGIICLDALGKEAEAKALNEKAYADFPNSIAFMTPIINEAVKEGDFTTAEALLNAAIDKEPENVSLLYNAAYVYFNLANETYQKANATSDNNEYEKLKGEYLELYGKAKPYLEKGHELEPEATDIMQFLAEIYSKLGDQEKALEMIRKKKAVEAK